MLIIPSGNPVGAYPLCTMTVTVYHQEGDTYQTAVYHKAFLDYRKTESTGKDGTREQSSFLLVIPGNHLMVHPGDKVLMGTGPNVSTREQWAALIPARVNGLVVVRSVDPKYWGSQIVHVEATG